MAAYSVERRTSKICFSGEWSDDSGRNVNVQFVQSAIWPRASIKTDLPDQRSAERRAEDPIGTHAAVADTYRQGTRHRSFLLTFVDMGTKASRRVTRRWTSLHRPPTALGYLQLIGRTRDDPVSCTDRRGNRRLWRYVP